jgi:hypothetical protein
LNAIFRRLRAMVGLGALWALVWTPIGLGITLIQFLTSGFGLPPAELIVALAVSGARNGFLAGFLFAGGLGIAYRGRGFADLSPKAFAAIGAVAGMLLPAGTMLSLALSGWVPPVWAMTGIVAFGGGLGAATAVASLKLAQAAPTEIGAAASPPGLEPQGHASAPTSPSPRPQELIRNGAEGRSEQKR